MHYWQVIVGNLGTVWLGKNGAEAMRVYGEYVRLSKSSEGGRAAGEQVTLFCDGDVKYHHSGDVR